MAQNSENSMDYMELRYILIDIGANLTNKKCQRDLDSIIQRANDSGVQKIMVTGTSVQSSKEAIRLTRLYPGILYSTAGVHPHDAKSWDSSSYEALKELASNDRECVAIGECGLDFYRNFSPPEVQLEVFEKQIQLAIEVKKPLFLHERDAHEDFVRILEKYQGSLPPVVIHCFTGTTKELCKYLQMGFYIGLTGYLWKDKTLDGVRKALEERLLPLNRLMIESDAPFMYPNVQHNKIPEHVKNSFSSNSMMYLQRYCSFNRNEPCSLAITLEMIAAFMHMKPEEVALKTSFNALKVFRLN